MEITDAIIRNSVAQRPFGASEPFVSGNEKDISSFYSDVLTALERIPGAEFGDDVGEDLSTGRALSLHSAVGQITDLLQSRSLMAHLQWLMVEG